MTSPYALAAASTSTPEGLTGIADGYALLGRVDRHRETECLRGSRTHRNIRPLGEGESLSRDAHRVGVGRQVRQGGFAAHVGGRRAGCPAPIIRAHHRAWYAPAGRIGHLAAYGPRVSLGPCRHQSSEEPESSYCDEPNDR